MKKSMPDLFLESGMARERVGRSFLYFGIFLAVLLLLFWYPLLELLAFSSNNNHHTHMVFIPVVSLYFLIGERREIFRELGRDLLLGASLIGLGLLLYVGVSVAGDVGHESNRLALTAMAFLCCLYGGFMALFGGSTFKQALFPLLFLLFIIPLPQFLLQQVVYFLQKGSAEFSYGLFQLTGVPIFREGFIFVLPGMTVYVAEECSGIRSTLALVITGVLIGKVFFDRWWKFILMGLFLVPLVLIKNAIRIVSITLLAIYVDPGFMEGWLHTGGGIVFFSLALLMLAPLVWVLKSDQEPARALDQNELET